MLLMPELDTYHCLEKFARNPTSTNKVSFYLLKRRALNKAYWDAFSSATNKEDFKNQLDLRISWSKRDIKAAKASGVKTTAELASMSKEQQQAYMLKCIKAAGLAVDSLPIVKT